MYNFFFHLSCIKFDVILKKYDKYLGKMDRIKPYIPTEVRSIY